MQVIPAIWSKTLGITNFHGIETGIDAGIRVLKHYIEKSDGNITKALQGYNGASKGTDYSDSVYRAVGRFTARRTGNFEFESE